MCSNLTMCATEVIQRYMERQQVLETAIRTWFGTRWLKEMRWRHKIDPTYFDQVSMSQEDAEGIRFAFHKMMGAK